MARKGGNGKGGGGSTVGPPLDLVGIDGWSDSHLLTAYRLARDGVGDADIAEELGVDLATYRTWRRDRPTFRQALEQGREDSAQAEHALRAEVGGLERRQWLFVQEYLKDLDAVAAVRRAGYSPKSASMQAGHLMKNDKVLEAIRREFAKRARRMELTQDRVLREVAAIALLDPIHLFDADTGGLRQVSEMPEAVRRALATFEVEQEETTGEDGVTVRTVAAKIKTWDKPKALELLMRHLGMLNDKMKVDHNLALEGLLPRLLGMVEQRQEAQVVDGSVVEAAALDHINERKGDL